MTELPPFPSTRNPTTIPEVDENLRFWSGLAIMTGLPVVNNDGSDAIDELLEIRHALTNTP
jgi:hypothetical protein